MHGSRGALVPQHVVLVVLVLLCAFLLFYTLVLAFLVFFSIRRHFSSNMGTNAHIGH